MPQESNVKVCAEIQNLAPSAVIELYVLELGDNENLYFHAGSNELNGDVIWQGQKYMALPIDTEGFDMSSKGELPRPKLAIANVQGLFSGLIRKHDDLVGLKLIRKRTFARYLDAENFKNGNPEADPTIFFPDDIWYIDKKEQETKQVIQWELASAFDLQGVQLPKRQIIQNYCQWKYRSGICGYDGPYVNIDDQVCTNEEDDVCSKKLSSCKFRFNLTSFADEKPILPFGGFPGATRNNG
jgi:lambda family phage minor tail protein L